MKILQVHNNYQLPGGEDVVVKNEYDLLTKNNNIVIQYLRKNKEIGSYSALQRGKLLFDTSYSKKTYSEVSEIIKKDKPDICHVHNILPLVSPSVYYACKDLNVKVIQSLHNYRLLCTNPSLFREEKICEECIGKSVYHSLKYGCYKHSKAQTFAVARMIETNRSKKTWDKKVDAYIALTQFSKNKFVEGGLPEEKIFIKPNFLADSPCLTKALEDYFLYAGGLEKAKGIDVLLASLKYVNPHLKLLAAGDGSLKNRSFKSTLDSIFQFRSYGE